MPFYIQGGVNEKKMPAFVKYVPKNLSSADGLIRKEPYLTVIWSKLFLFHIIVDFLLNSISISIEFYERKKRLPILSLLKSLQNVSSCLINFDTLYLSVQAFYLIIIRGERKLFIKILASHKMW